LTFSPPPSSIPLDPSVQVVRPLAVLLLGMFFSIGVYTPSRGQGYRDSVRGYGLQNDGFDVYSLDDKHDEREFEESNQNKKKHCRTNFCQTDRMMKAIREMWGPSVGFTYIILDYFFCPVRSEQ